MTQIEIKLETLCSQQVCVFIMCKGINYTCNTRDVMTEVGNGQQKASPERLIL